MLAHVVDPILDSSCCDQPFIAMVTALVRVYVIALLSMVHCNAQKDLYFSFMLSQSTDGVTSSIEQDTSGVATAVSIALETINNDSSILEGYRLMYGDILNSQVYIHVYIHSAAAAAGIYIDHIL